ncbi:TetR/AcrR family transcriptional regulator [Microscilla marina]|uniref:Transcriptional regulator, TetR family protein n=1 Tax=Microscilla marina ATCC 23134 TaxID=313606 RepID=A1ZH44_MICM2|nr:TetR/AcrR family transcriptional regulator [Microscilla marina]EAY30313.1 transcriptional regulator, TetR family protein [Microscilla marina ATCC 23134]
MNDTLKEQQLTYIITKAEEVFFMKGFTHTNISDISKAAKRSRTTIYSYFETKENLYLAVIYHSFLKFITVLEQVNIEGKNGLEKILAYGKGYLDFCQQCPQHHQIILDYYTLIKTNQWRATNQMTYAGKVRKIALRPLKVMITEITNGQQDHSITSELPPATLFINIWAQLIGITHLSQNLKNPNSFILLDIELKDWRQNTLNIIQNLLTTK